ncbi:MAG: DUF421 domain-containing protein [Sphingomonadaceae bacterium]|nr:DUF421 domain-containing protein [Sphingomonadaceae bacterium]
MFFESDIYDALARAAILTPLALFWIVFLTRIVGLRSFSKMTAFDFVATVATGSLLANAGVATNWPDFVQTLAAIFALFLVQMIVAWSRQRSKTVQHILDNNPRILMRDGKIDEQALRDTRTARSDVIAKLREANALELGKVRYVVLEATGDIAVLHGDRIDDELIDKIN